MWILAGLAAAAAGLLVWRARKAQLPKEFALCEYWVYVPEPKLPDHAAIMDRMVGNNPHSQRGRPCIGATEGLVFSDVRLYVNVGTRKKNPYWFRPDLIDRVEGLTAEVLERLAAAQGIIQIRYISPQRLSDLRHLQFVPHMADAVASLAKGTLIFDQVLSRMWLAEEFFAQLDKTPRVMNPGFHVEVRWHRGIDEGIVVTSGLLKAGLWELRTKPVPEDYRVLTLAVVEQVSNLMWAKRQQEESLEVEAYGDRFVVEAQPIERERTLELTITRFQSSDS